MPRDEVAHFDVVVQAHSDQYEGAYGHHHFISDVAHVQYCVFTLEGRQIIEGKVVREGEGGKVGEINKERERERRK